MKYKELEQYASDCQLAADEIAKKHIDLIHENRILSVLQNYCNFNVFHTVGLVPWVFGKSVIRFISFHGEELKRKFELHEFKMFCDKFRIISMCYEIKDFNHFKSFKITKHDKNHIK